MKSTVEPVEGNKVKLTIEVDSETFEHEIDAAFKRIAREVRIPGFRPGKAPRKLLEARIGPEVARGDALEHALPKYYADAVREHEVDVIGPPEIDLTSGAEDGNIAFDAVVEIRPTVNPAGYDSLRVTIETPVATDDDVEEQVDRLREGNATFEVVERAADRGDVVTIDVTGSREGEPLEGLVAEDYLYEVGAGTVVPELDDELEGASAGDTLTFTAEHPEPDEDPVDFSVTVKEVKAKVLPEPDDAFAQQVSEFETIAELRADIKERLGEFKAGRARTQVEQRTMDAVAELVTEDIPIVLVQAEIRHRLQEMSLQLQAGGLDMNAYMEHLGEGADAFTAELGLVSERSVKTDLALRAIAEDLGVEIGEDDLDGEIQRLAQQTGGDADAIRKELERRDQIPALRSDLKKRKALEWLIERVELVDEGGSAIDRASLEEGSPPADEAPTEDAE